MDGAGLATAAVCARVSWSYCEREGVHEGEEKEGEKRMTGGSEEGVNSDRV